MVCNSVFEVETSKYEDERFIRHIWTFRNYKEAEKQFVNMILGDDVPEVALRYVEFPGCWKQKTIPMRHKQIAYDRDGVMIKQERRRVYEEV
jgi:hypothetical protein